MKLEGSSSAGQGLLRRKRPARACIVRTWPATVEQHETTVPKPGPEEDSPPHLSPTQEQRCQLRNMWQLASVLNFLHVFRPVLQIKVKFSAEDLETALITPNDMLDDIHIPLLESRIEDFKEGTWFLLFGDGLCPTKAILPPRRIALGRDMWVIMLCKTLKDWWPWVAEGELPIVASHGEEILAYKELVPGIRLLILKALCEIRVEQDDIRNYIDDTLKNGGKLSTFHKERIGGNAFGTSYWYEDDSTIGHRLYREIQKIQVKTKPNGKGSSSQLEVSCQWETIATNLNEFRVALENGALSRVDDGLGERLKTDILPTLEKCQKRKEQALKRQQRHSMLLHKFSSSQGDSTYRYLRDRKPVNYTCDDFDRSIEEAIQISNKRHSSPESLPRSDASGPSKSASNDKGNGDINGSTDASSGILRDGGAESDVRQKLGLLKHGKHQGKRPQRYLESKYARGVLARKAEFHSKDAVFGKEGFDGMSP